MKTRAHDVAVIGAGPYGLATGAHLRSRGLDIVVFGQTMSSWREAMPAGMILRSERASSNISSPDPTTRLANYLTQTGATSIPLLLPIANFIDYGTWFERTQLADSRRDEMVRSVSHDDTGTFHLELESGESLPVAAARETLEETGWTVVPTALVGIYRWEAADNGATYVRFTFTGEARGHDPARPLDAGIVRALWLTYDEIAARDAAHRSPLVLRCIDDYRAGKRYPLDLVTEVAVQRSLWETS